MLPKTKSKLKNGGVNAPPLRCKILPRRRRQTKIPPRRKNQIFKLLWTNLSDRFILSTREYYKINNLSVEVRLQQIKNHHLKKSDDFLEGTKLHDRFILSPLQI